MPKVTIDHKSTLSPQDAFAKIKTFFESDQDIRRLDPNLTCSFVEAQLRGKATGKQFKADISVSGVGAGSLVNVVVDLPLLLTPLKGKIQETIQKKLSKYVT
ncbi:MAG: hypothetical protein COT73_11420 [Bdellovibrio sp. CG10_big_fil_rev_8_21_14_0_10_47_8]|nr:MAG: hypothetical protein COT73_11420 [Bdellovibrio sp. CG10_big_fil_rev_8_21_14_0_10_47_8]